MLSIIVTSLLICGICFATTGVDISQPCGEFSCLKSQLGVDFSITRAWYSSGSFDSASITNLKNAQSAGIPYTDVYMFPCRGKSAKTQIDDLISDLASGLAGLPLKPNTLPNEKNNDIIARGMRAGYSNKDYKKENTSILNYTQSDVPRDIPSWRPVQDNSIEATYGMIWMDIENNPSSGCGWGTNYASNCAYLQTLINATLAKGKKPGVYSSLGEWESVMGSKGACTSVKATPLWYAHYDKNPSFSDWSSMQFGGWTSPAMKQYEGDVTWCSFDVDADWY